MQGTPAAELCDEGLEGLRRVGSVVGRSGTVGLGLEVVRGGGQNQLVGEEGRRSPSRRDGLCD